MMGHVFLVQGDLTRLACESWLLPTDAALKVEPHWLANRPQEVHRTLGDGSRLAIHVPPGWGDDGLRAMKLDWPERRHQPQPWLVNVGGTPDTPVTWYLQ